MTDETRIRGVAWRVYEVRGKDRERCLKDLADDVVSRASVRLADAKHFGWDRDTFFVHVEGGDEAAARVDASLSKYGRVPTNAEALRRRLLWEDDASAASLGSVMSHLPPPEFVPDEKERQKQKIEQAKAGLKVAMGKAGLFVFRLKKRFEKRS